MRYLLVLVIFPILFSCEEQEPFDNTLLEISYWNIFSESLNMIAFDNFAVAGFGYQQEKGKNYYIYTNDLIDTVSNKRLYFLHTRINNLIYSSKYDSIQFKSDASKNVIVWSIQQNGIIEGCEKYDKQNNLISSESYTIELNKTFTTDGVTSSWDGRLLYLHEKRINNSRGELKKIVKYKYNDDDSYVISYFNADGTEKK